MTVLGIDTHGTSTSVAVVTDCDHLHQLREEGCGHNEQLIELISMVLNESGLAMADLDAVGVVVGPGMFTSLRVGLSLSKAVGEIHGLPVKGINTLEAYASAARNRFRDIVVALDARKEQVYAAAYSDGTEALPPCVVSPGRLDEILPASLRHGRTAVVGDAAATVAVELGTKGWKLEVVEELELDGADVGALASVKLESEAPDDVATLVPTYIRRTDAELARHASSS